MSELRYSIISRDWVIIATERAKRPEDFKKAVKEKEALPERKADCPFCPGNEGDCKDETFRIGDAKRWRTRTIYNKFPALSPNEKLERKVGGVYNSITGYGFHEVIVEHPRHDIVLALMNDEEVEDVIRTYKSRYVSISKEKDINAITVFKNHGPQAGSSLAHPHSQLVATPVVPPMTRSRMEQAARYFDVTGRCVFCYVLEEELKAKKRIILETDKFVSFIPYASLLPFTIWIVPRRHMASFDEMDSSELKDLARNLRVTLGKLYKGLNNPDFNYTIRSIPVNEKGGEYFHWFLNIIPRITHPAGFELGSGMFINTSLPEEGAEFLRGVK